MVGYLYVNYSHTNNCYSYVKLISKKVNLEKIEYQNIIIAHSRVFTYGQNLHDGIHLTYV